MFRTSRWFAPFSLVALLSLVARSEAHAQALPQTMQVSMPDGVTLASDVWVPLFDATPRPVLLRRTPYGRAGIDLQAVQTLVAAGLTVVSQDVRGRGDSTGRFLPFFDDKDDGAASIDWIVAQPWSNGKVATWGASAEGIVQFMAMARAPEALACAHIAMPTHDVYAEMFPGGLWRTDLGTSWLLAQGVPEVIETWKQHELNDAYWEDARLSRDEMALVDHPVFILGGFFDVFAPSQVRALEELQNHAAQASRGDMFLIMGPWTHGGVASRVQGGLLFPADAPYNDYIADLAAYLTWCTLDGPRPAFSKVRYYLTELTDNLVSDPGDAAKQLIEARGEWRSAETFPPAGTKNVRLHLQDGQRLHGDVPSQDNAPHSLPVDPTAPVPSVGGGNLTSAAGPFDQTSIDAREDVWWLETDPVTEEVEVVGSIRAKLWVASATSDADVIVRVEVVTPGGKAVAMADGAQRGRFVRGTQAITKLTPGAPVRFELTLGPVALRLAKGQALRFSISGTSTPRYEPGPNLAERLDTYPTPQVTTLSFYRDAAHPSEFRIPILRGTLPHAVEVADEPDDPDAESGAPSPGADAGALTPDDADSEMQPGGAAASQPSEGCGCRLGATQRQAGPTLLMLLGLALLWRRRRRAR